MKTCWCGNNIFSEYSKHYWKCNKCNTLVTKIDISYDPENIQDNTDFYGKDYWEKKMVAVAETTNISEMIDLYLKERAVYWLKTLLQYVLPGQGTIAEVGCGLGQFSYLLKQAGYRQIAFELSPHICQYVQDTLGINVICGAMQKNIAAYDGVVAFDVLEHLTDPEGFLRTVTESVKEDGILLIQTPCFDETLCYKEMQQKKPHFEKLLCENEHVYLFSREAVCQLLEEYGFSYVVFLDAYFGNDYDMFFVASKRPIHINAPEEIEEKLNQQENGRLLKALFALWSEQRDSTSQLSALHEQQSEHMDQISTLTAQLQISEADRAERLRQINNLTERIKVLENEQSAKLKQINNLSTKLRTSEADSAARLEQINTLTTQLQISEVDRAERLKQINNLTERVKVLENEQRVKLKQINDLSTKLRTIEADSAARLEQINILTVQLQTSEADRAARLDRINLLTEQLETSEEDRAERLKQILSLTSTISELQHHSQNQ